MLHMHMRVRKWDDDDVGRCGLRGEYRTCWACMPGLVGVASSLLSELVSTGFGGRGSSSSGRRVWRHISLCIRVSGNLLGIPELRLKPNMRWFGEIPVVEWGVSLYRHRSHLFVKLRVFYMYLCEMNKNKNFWGSLAQKVYEGGWEANMIYLIFFYLEINSLIREKNRKFLCFFFL